MNDDPGQPQWEQPSQYGQPEWSQQSAQQYDQYNQYGQYNPPPMGYVPPQYNANQYGVPSYAQAQPQGRQNDTFLMSWLATRLLIRVVVLVAVLVLCGGCAFFALLASLAHP